MLSLRWENVLIMSWVNISENGTPIYLEMVHIRQNIFMSIQRLVAVYLNDDVCIVFNYIIFSKNNNFRTPIEPLNPLYQHLPLYLHQMKMQSLWTI